MNNSSLDFYDIYFLNSNTGFASAINGNLDSLYTYTTTNGGLTWSYVSAHGGPYNIFFPELFFTSATTGFSSFDSGILKTTDGGVTWSVVYTDPNMDAWCSMSSPDGTNIFGGGQLGWVFASTNSGNSWIAPTQATYPAYGMYFDSPTHGFYCGGNGFGSGAVEVTNNGGSTWTPAFLTSQTLMCMDFPSTTRGYAGGTNGIIVRYDDGPQSSPSIGSSSLQVYPNPTTDFLTLENATPVSSVCIVNSIGEIVFTEFTSDNLMRIDVSTFAPGVYLLHISSGEEIAQRKFVVE